MAVEIEDRIADELAGTVIRRLAAAVRFDYLDVQSLGEMELGCLVRPPAQRDDRLVLQQDDRVGDSRLDTAAASERWSTTASP